MERRFKQLLRLSESVPTRSKASKVPWSRVATRAGRKAWAASKRADPKVPPRPRAGASLGCALQSWDNSGMPRSAKRLRGERLSFLFFSTTMVDFHL